MLNKKALEAAEQAVYDKFSVRTQMTAFAIEAYLNSLAKAGLGIRPREPTEVMLGEGKPDDRLGTMCTQIWQAMWDAGKPDG